MSSLEDFELELSAAISHASKNGGELEHPWYGVWALVLRKLCRVQKGEKKGWFIVPVIYPQDPVAHVHLDLRRQALQRQSVAVSPPSPATRRTGAVLQKSTFTVGPFTPPSFSQSTTSALGSPLDLPLDLPVRKKRRRKEANSDSEDNLDVGILTVGPNYQSNAAAVNSLTPPAGADRNPDSMRFPDFSRIISFYAPHLSSPYEIRDLIMENKSRILLSNHSNVYRYMHLATRQQTKDQAWHAFQSDKNLKIIGCIMAYGEFWTYEEYRREDIPDPAMTPHDNDDYVPPDDVPSDEETDNPSRHSPIENIPPSALSQEINLLFEEQLWLEVGTQESDYMLSLIENRLREINWNFWSQVTASATVCS